MASATMVPVSAYLAKTWRPDRQYVARSLAIFAAVLDRTLDPARSSL